MTSIPTTSDGSQPREWSINNRTLILSAGAPGRKRLAGHHQAAGWSIICCNRSRRWRSA